MPTTPHTDDQVRAMAYALWLEEGRPEGRAEAHWLKARELVLNSFATTELLTSELARPAEVVVAAEPLVAETPAKTAKRAPAAKAVTKSAPRKRS